MAIVITLLLLVFCGTILFVQRAARKREMMKLDLHNLEGPEVETGPILGLVEDDEPVE
jgi:hypothetical protein